MPFRDLPGHPSHGMIGAFHSSVGGSGMRLFASALPGHRHVVRVVIKEAVSYGDGVDGGVGEMHHRGGRTIASVYLSAAQWAEFLTCMNVGDGVPCTLAAYWSPDGQFIEPGVPPVEETSVNRAARVAVERTEDTLTQAHDDLVALLAEPETREAIPKRVRDRLDGIALHLGYNLGTNVAFRVDRVREAAAKAVAAAKAEVDAFLTHAIQRTGLAALRGEPLPFRQIEEDKT